MVVMPCPRIHRSKKPESSSGDALFVNDQDGATATGQPATSPSNLGEERLVLENIFRPLTPQRDEMNKSSGRQEQRLPRLDIIRPDFVREKGSRLSLVALSNRIRRRLSRESQASRRISKPVDQRVASPSSTGVENTPQHPDVSVDIIGGDTISDTGYDSDARFILTPQITQRVASSPTSILSRLRRKRLSAIESGGTASNEASPSIPHFRSRAADADNGGLAVADQPVPRDGLSVFGGSNEKGQQSSSSGRLRRSSSTRFSSDELPRLVIPKSRSFNSAIPGYAPGWHSTEFPLHIERYGRCSLAIDAVAPAASPRVGPPANLFDAPACSLDQFPQTPNPASFVFSTATSRDFQLVAQQSLNARGLPIFGPSASAPSTTISHSVTASPDPLYSSKRASSIYSTRTNNLASSISPIRGGSSDYGSPTSTKAELSSESGVNNAQTITAPQPVLTKLDPKSMKRRSRFVEDFPGLFPNTPNDSQTQGQDTLGTRASRTRSASDGWLSRGKRQGYGYTFVSQGEEEAMVLWERAVKAHANQMMPESSRRNSRNIFRRKRKSSQKDVNHHQSQDDSVSVISTSTSEVPQQEPTCPSIGDVPVGSPVLLPKKTSPANNCGRAVSLWARFPSHTRAERNASAGRSDDVASQDFDSIRSQRNDSDNQSLCLTKSRQSDTRSYRKKGKRFIKQWVRLHRYNSLSRRRHKAGQRALTSMSEQSRCPERELIVGGRIGYRSLEGLGGVEQESKRHSHQPREREGPSLAGPASLAEGPNHHTQELSGEQVANPTCDEDMDTSIEAYTAEAWSQLYHDCLETLSDQADGGPDSGNASRHTATANSPNRKGEDQRDLTASSSTDLRGSTTEFKEQQLANEIGARNNLLEMVEDAWGGGT
ncbi:hypothetical protein AJ80_00756 [Polytolypa hystricis UAMH7299]|uniref:Uncharacterized protein n=1 Tax=Polytolypa hystricis (strain UAMH7299) TaxID=1447883 RepID=A0A2B7Z1P1_POLH7|nr:hypothetical protein AJ80_00756 [Polytolypa hystricis UAMH7299]